MARRDADIDNLVAGFEPAVAMGHRHAMKRPARLGVDDDAGDLGFRHAGIMLDLERRQTAALVAAQADEARQRADVAPPGGQRAAVTGDPLTPIRRDPPADPVLTGVSVIDALTTLVRGQKLAVFSLPGLPHLGLACDPQGGRIEAPCIERNAVAAVKAITAARMALHGDGSHFVSLDAAIKTMRDTGADMADKYKETSLGGLALNVVEC